MLFVTCHTHDIYSKILSKLTKSVPKCLIYTHCFRARSLFIFGNLFFLNRNVTFFFFNVQLFNILLQDKQIIKYLSYSIAFLEYKCTKFGWMSVYYSTRYQVKPPYISTKCTMHALPWLIYCPLPKKQQSRRRRKTHIEAHLYAAGHISSNRRGFLVMIWTLPWC